MLLSCILNPNSSYSRIVFVLSVIWIINYFLSRVSFFCIFVFGSYEPVSGYLLKVTEAEQEEGNQPRRCPHHSPCLIGPRDDSVVSVWLRSFIKPGWDDWRRIHGGERSAWEERGQTRWRDRQDGAGSGSGRQTGLHPSHAQPQAAAPSRHPHRWEEQVNTAWSLVQGLIAVLISAVTQWLGQVLSCGCQPILCSRARNLENHQTLWPFL